MVNKLNITEESIPNIHQPSDLAKNFGLTADELLQIVEGAKTYSDLGSDPEENALLRLSNYQSPLLDRLLDNIARSYAKRCMDILKHKYNASADDAYDVFIDQMLRFRLLLLQGKVDVKNLQSYFTTMVVTGYLKKKERSKEVSMEEDSMLSLQEESSDAWFSEGDAIHAMQKVIQLLCENCRLMIQFAAEGRVAGITPNQRIAAALNLKIDAAKKRKERLLNRIRNMYFNIYEETKSPKEWACEGICK
jgi:hypothetical protein